MELKDIVKDPTVIAEDATFRDALTAMMREEVNVLMVIDEDGVLIGEVSVSDLMDAIVPEYVNGDNMLEHLATEELFTEAVRGAADTPVLEFMSADIDPVNIEDGLMEVAASAIAHQKARIPVVDADGRPVGIISRRGLKHVLAGALGIATRR